MKTFAELEDCSFIPGKEWLDAAAKTLKLVCQNISIANNNGTKQEISAKVVEGTAFAIHKEVEYAKSWVITHVPTGNVVIQGLPTRRDAKVAIVRLIPLLDWDIDNRNKLCAEDTKHGNAAVSTIFAMRSCYTGLGKGSCQECDVYRPVDAYSLRRIKEAYKQAGRGGK